VFRRSHVFDNARTAVNPSLEAPQKPPVFDGSSVIKYMTVTATPLL
jgi:hypothetical protein